jgi:hypothetical protein
MKHDSNNINLWSIKNPRIVHKLCPHSVRKFFHSSITHWGKVALFLNQRHCTRLRVHDGQQCALVGAYIVSWFTQLTGGQLFFSHSEIVLFGRVHTHNNQAKPKCELGAETCAKRKLTSPCLLAIPACDRVAGLYNRHLNSNREIC